MNLTPMVDEIARAVTASVSRGLAPIQRQVEELLRWKSQVGEIRNGLDGAKGDPGRDGKDGAPGPAGKDATAVDVDQVVSKVLGLIPVPKDGRDGADGRDGRDGVDGKEGPAGVDGKDAPAVDLEQLALKVFSMVPAPKDGRDGINGKDGAPGERGADGRDGNGIARLEHDEKSHTLDIVMDTGDRFTLSMPVPQRGEKGDPGPAGKDGAQGLQGEKGDVASQEDITAAVTKAVDALLPTLVSKQVELAMPEIVARASVLVPPGRDGLPGRPGSPGEPGRDGAGIESLFLEQSDKRSFDLIIRSTDGTKWQQTIKFDGMVMDAGVHRPGESYEKGDAVTHGGSYWVAMSDTKATPGTSTDWRLVVKRGRDGRDAE